MMTNTVTAPKKGLSRILKESVKTYRLDDDEHSHSPEDASSDEYELHHIGKCSTEPVQVQLMVNGKRLDMELDMGAALSLIRVKKESHFP